MKVFATYNIKGGVGKTTSAVNLAYLSARDGARTLVWDLDPQGAASYDFRVRPKVAGGGRRLLKRKTDVDRFIRGTDFEDLDLLPADFSYRHLDLMLDGKKNPRTRIARVLEPLADDYDHVFLDCAPSISLVSESVFHAADALLAPTIPTPLSMRTLIQLVEHLREMEADRPRVLAFFCMVDRRKALHRSTCAFAADRARSFLTTSIPYASQVELMGLRRAPLHVFAPRSPAALAYEALWHEILARTSREAEPTRASSKAARNELRSVLRTMRDPDRNGG